MNTIFPKHFLALTLGENLSGNKSRRTKDKLYNIIYILAVDTAFFKQERRGTLTSCQLKIQLQGKFCEKKYKRVLRDEFLFT